MALGLHGIRGKEKEGDITTNKIPHSHGEKLAIYLDAPKNSANKQL
jgi:hypothetical protein